MEFDRDPAALDSVRKLEHDIRQLRGERDLLFHKIKRALLMIEHFGERTNPLAIAAELDLEKGW